MCPCVPVLSSLATFLLWCDGSGSRALLLSETAFFRAGFDPFGLGKNPAALKW